MLLWVVTDRCDWLVKFLALWPSSCMHRQLFGSHMAITNYSFHDPDISNSERNLLTCHGVEWGQTSGEATPREAIFVALSIKKVFRLFSCDTCLSEENNSINLRLTKKFDGIKLNIFHFSEYSHGSKITPLVSVHVFYLQFVSSLDQVSLNVCIVYLLFMFYLVPVLKHNMWTHFYLQDKNLFRVNQAPKLFLCCETALDIRLGNGCRSADNHLALVSIAVFPVNYIMACE